MLTAEHITIETGRKTICQNLSLELRAGDVWGILGPNGSGKTTLLYALSGLHTLASGDIRLNNVSLSQYSIKAIARRIGILFQDFNSTCPQTVWEYCLASRFPHLSYFKKESVFDEDIMTQSLRLMDLEHHAHCLITNLSGGEKRRLALAALLAQTPDIYLLDEPTNHLDVRHQAHTLNHFRHLAVKSGAAVMMSLHDINLAQHYCNHVLLLYPDKEVLTGETNTVLTPDNVSRLYQHTMRKISLEDNSFWVSDFSQASWRDLYAPSSYNTETHNL